MTKKCTKCGEEKDLDEFGKDKNRKDGLNPWCRSCRKEYCIENRDKIAEYRQMNKDKIREYYLQRKDDILEQRKEYRIQNRDKIAEYRQMNKDKIREYKREYRKGYEKARRKNDPEYHLMHNIRRQVYKALKSKNQIKTSRTAQFVDAKAINEHLGPRPEGYHLDHIIPLSKFDLTNLEHLKLAFLPQNLRYIPALENISKNDKIIPELIASCPVLTEIARKIL